MPLTSETLGARRLVEIVEKSQVPFGESSQTFADLKAKVDRGERLTPEEHDRLLKLVKIAEEWERSVESSANTERDETLSG